MIVKEKDAEVIKNALQEWENDGLLSEDLHMVLSDRVLSESLYLHGTFFQRCAFFAVFFFTIASFIIISYCIQLEEKSMRWIAGFLAAISYFIGLNFIKIEFVTHVTQNPLAKKFFLLLGAILTAVCLISPVETCPYSSSYQSFNPLKGFLSIMITVIIYGIIGFVGQSTFVWSLALLFIGMWFGILKITSMLWLPWTGKAELAMYKLSFFHLFFATSAGFIFLGLILILLSYVLGFHKKLEIFKQQTLWYGLFYFFMVTWSLPFDSRNSFWSLFHVGFYTNKTFVISYPNWVLNISAAFLCIYFGGKNNIVVMWRFGIIFFFLNLIKIIGITFIGEVFFEKFICRPIFIEVSLLIYVLRDEKIWNTLEKIITPEKRQKPKQEKDIEVIKNALQEWKTDGLLSEDLHRVLSESLYLHENSYKKIRTVIDKRS
ncbi:MAG: hypothetical protein LBQ03_01285 [Puniceicoccales bacterium]|jgi:hypothetical protein|nr:hypothetical protein [Puniceicoccales bacterium]